MGAVYSTGVDVLPVFVINVYSIWLLVFTYEILEYSFSMKDDFPQFII